VPSNLAQFPISEFHPIMQFKITELLLICVPSNIIEFEMRTPSSMITPLPIITFGPKSADLSTYACLETKTLSS